MQGVKSVHKLLHGAHLVGSDPYNAHQQISMKHINMQQAHRHHHFKNRALSIAQPLEVMTIIHNKMNHAKFACPFYVHKEKTIEGLFKFPKSIAGIFQCFIFKSCAFLGEAVPNILYVMLNNFSVF